jgi:hypothetical protein
MEQIMELLKAMDAKLKEIKEDMQTNKEMLAKMDSQLEKMEAWLRKMGTTNLEANPEETESEVVHERSLKKRLQWKMSEH